MDVQVVQFHGRSFPGFLGKGSQSHALLYLLKMSTLGMETAQKALL